MKQPLIKRVERILTDSTQKGADPRKRWEAVCEDLPEEVAEFGEMPIATLDDVPRDDAIYYAARDADATLRIFPKLSERIDAMGLRGVYEMDKSVIPMVARMQEVGMPCSVPYFEKLEPWLSKEMLGIKELINLKYRWNINPNSGDQTAAMLIALGVPLTKMTKGGKRESTNDKVLESLRGAHPVVGMVCDYRELAKLRDSFCVVLPRMVGADGRIRCNLRVTRVSSGRLSATDPNLLAIPVRTELGKKIREGFIAPKGRVLGSWDLDQIEMREMAHQSQDPVLCGWFIDGLDVHRMMGSEVFGKKPEGVSSVERYASKRLNFGVITGITEIGLSEQMGLAGAKGDWSVDRCREFIRDYFKILKGVASYLESCRAEARRHGYVRDRWGRIRYLPGVHSDIWWVREEALRQSHSFKISASAQGIMKHAMAAIWKVWRDTVPPGWIEPLLQIHDELLFELEDDGGLRDYWDWTVVNCLCNTTELSVPIKAKGSYGANWGVLKE